MPTGLHFLQGEGDLATVDICHTREEAEAAIAGFDDTLDYNPASIRVVHVEVSPPSSGLNRQLSAARDSFASGS
jgi:hypothetical protein